MLPAPKLPPAFYRLKEFETPIKLLFIKTQKLPGTVLIPPEFLCPVLSPVTLRQPPGYQPA
jgi:hypothetical protein